jgi:hypothetical protein
MAVEDDFENDQDGFSPVEMLEHYCQARGWTHERIGDDEIVANIQGSWSQYEARAVWRDEDRVLQFLALPDIRIPADKRTLIYETIGLINEQLWIGHFEMWASSGMLLFRHALLLDNANGAPLSLDQAETLCETAIDECERFYPVFQFVLWADKSPADAIASALIDTQGEA